MSDKNVLDKPRSLNQVARWLGGAVLVAAIIAVAAVLLGTHHILASKPLY